MYDVIAMVTQLGTKAQHQMADEVVIWAQVSLLVF
jgi:hypothetical protein